MIDLASPRRLRLVMNVIGGNPNSRTLRTLRSGNRARTGPVGLAVVGGVLAAALAPVVSGSPSTQFVCAVTLLAVSVVATLMIDWRRSGDRLSVLTLVGLFYLLAFVAGSLYVWINPSLVGTVSAHPPFDHTALIQAEWLCLFSWIAFVLGFWLRLFGWLSIPPLKLAPRQGQARSMTILYCIGWLARIAGIPRGLYFHPTHNTAVAQGSTLNQALHVFGLLPAVAMAYLGVVAHDRPRLRRLYWAALATELAFAVPSGQRVDSVTVLLLAVIVYYYTHKRVPVKAIVIAATFSLFFVFPVLYLYRASNQDTGYQVSDLSGSLTTYTSGGLGNTLLFGVDSTLKRFSDIGLPAALEQYGRGRDPVSTGETIPWLVTNYIPHAVDPSKRNVIEFTDHLAYVLHVTPVLNSSYAPTQVGEMYLDFGTVGAVLAMLIIGSVYREVDQWLALRRESPLVLAIYAAFGFTVIQTQESLLATSFGGMVRNIVVLAIVIRVTTWFVGSRAQSVQ